MTARQIEAYRRRLAKVTQAHLLTSECVGAVIRFTVLDLFGAPNSAASRTVVGTLTSYRVYTGFGLMGPTVRIDVVICEACVGTPGGDSCADSEPHTLHPIDLVTLARNEDGVREVLLGAGS
ncbi:MAG TPA: hypothetical protein VMF51_18055 [Nocardioides sp.]|uniref:hypothetical protein n=1 Tax=Nocardioides sp. TaxID=35761 RepID=UPI002CFA58D2|nr:hypothetical protein [Nocardioides sp.]HTW17039.1 hypothetical protein [Nocardioides sp.]